MRESSDADGTNWNGVRSINNVKQAIANESLELEIEKKKHQAHNLQYYQNEGER